MKPLHVLRIFYLMSGIIFLAFFFFNSPTNDYEKSIGIDYRIHNTQASKIFINSISMIIVPRKDIYKCGDRYVNKVQYSICWGDIYNRDPNEWLIMGKQETSRDIIGSFNSSKPKPIIYDGRVNLREKFRFGMSIFFFVAGIFILWRTRFNFSKIIQNIYDKA